MADSGIDSESLTSPRETISEDSSSDLNDLNDSVILRKNDACSKISSKHTSLVHDYQENLQSDTRGLKNVTTDCEPKNHFLVLDTDAASNGIEPDVEISATFKLVGSSSRLLDTAKNTKKNEDQTTDDLMIQQSKQPNITIEHLDSSSSSSSNYYFIDASSLNDDTEETTTNDVEYPIEQNECSTQASSKLPNISSVSSSSLNNYFSNDNNMSFNYHKSVNTQNRRTNNEDTQFFGHHNFSDYHSIAGLDSQLAEKELTNCSKESLVVEIKEADSGESALHSPCPDNTKTNSIKLQEKSSSFNLPEEEIEKQENDVEKRPLLIRRNTFELDSNDEKLSSLRQEYERRQGNLVFQNSITQYSQHHLDGESFFDVAGQPDLAENDKSDMRNSSVLSFVPNCNLAFNKYDSYVVKKVDNSTRLIKDTTNDTNIHSMPRSSSDRFLANNDDDENIYFNSLPVNINDEINLSQTKFKLKRNEAAPIISGGSSSSDFKKPTDSPVVKRKTESTPIVSGGSVIMPEPTVNRFKNKPFNVPNPTTAWVVDMSDCRSPSTDKQPTFKKVKESQPVMSASYTPSTDKERNGARNKQKDSDGSQPSSLGFFVNFDDIKSTKEQPNTSKSKRRPSDTAIEKNYCEFFIDLSDKSTSSNSEKKLEKPSSISLDKCKTESPSQIGDSKKNIFSMFIDLSGSDSATVNKTGFSKSNSSSKLSDKQFQVHQRRASEDQGSVEKKSKSSVFMFIESDTRSPLVRRRTLSTSKTPAFKRHSWNTDKNNEQQLTTPVINNEKQPLHSPVVSAKRIHKRAHSLSLSRVGDSSTSNTSSLEATLHKLHSSDSVREESKQEDKNSDTEQHEHILDYEIRDTPPNSHIEIINEELLASLKNRNYQELDSINEQHKEDDHKSEHHPDEFASEATDTRKSHLSSSSSISGPSSTSDNFNLRLTELLNSTRNKLAITPDSVKSYNENNLNTKNTDKVIMKTNVSKIVTPTSFVRLSDLDNRPPSSADSTNSNSRYNKTKSENSQRVNSNVSESFWIESKLAISSRTNDTLNKTLNKKLSSNATSAMIKTDYYEEIISNEGDAEGMISESDLSSLQSSMGRSGQEGSTEETETSTSFALNKPFNRLGEDLLRMFLDEINPDVTIDVAGRRIRAHKCILSSRCQYFAAILSGNWIESTGNIIGLPGYSYNAVHFALCHIYSGESCIPDSISIVELATLADMLCLEGLKEVIGFTLKVKYCHLFHKPCNGCTVGILECLPLAAAYGLDEVYRKSLKWITRYFVRIWPSKEFATLSRELMEKCYHQHIVHMSTDNVLQTIMDCDKLLTTLPNVRWAEPVFRLVSNLVDTSMKYLIDNYSSVLGNENFQRLDRELMWNIGRLEDHLLAAAERLPPEQACKAYSKLHKMFMLSNLDDSQHPKFKWSPLFMDLMDKIRSQVEKCLIRDAARAARTNSWTKMDLELRRRIQDLAGLILLPNEVSIKRPSRHSNFLKEPKESQESKMSLNKLTINRNLDLRKVRMAISEHNDRTYKQTPLLQTRKVMNKPRTDPLERKIKDKLINENNSVSRPKSWPNKIEVKSRYLEPRTRPTKEPSPQINQEKPYGQQRRKIMISSSDSSRTSSPAMKRAAEKKALTKITKAPIKKDCKTLSSDSLRESNNRLGLKKDIMSKSCGITRPESPLLKTNNLENGISSDSLSEFKKKITVNKKINKMDVSTDSLMTDVTTTTTPKSGTTYKSSPVLGKLSSKGTNVSQAQNNEKFKKSSPLTQQRNLSTLTPGTTRRSVRSLESSTAASRNRAAATINTYNGSLNLRKSLLDAAKAPDIPSKAINSAPMTRGNMRSSLVKSTFSSSQKLEKKDQTSISNQRSNLSPGSKKSPKLNNSKLNKSTNLSSKKPIKQDDKFNSKNKSQAAGGSEGPKFLHQSSRSGTFLKDEPTILNKSDIATAAIDI